MTGTLAGGPHPPPCAFLRCASKTAIASAAVGTLVMFSAANSAAIGQALRRAMSAAAMLEVVGRPAQVDPALVDEAQ